MSMSEMICKLELYGLSVSMVPHHPETIHVDGYSSVKSKGLPDWIYECGGWGVSSCGFGRVFMFKMKSL